jgi:parallel beta-helix repeat protein
LQLNSKGHKITFLSKRFKSFTKERSYTIKKKEMILKKMRTEKAIAIGILLALFFLVSSCTATIYVPADYETIQAAVNAASHGDTIIVRDGTYIENIEVHKSLTIRSENGPNSTIVRAEDPGYDVFSVTADRVAISGFTAEGAIGAAGISLFYADYCNISDNHCLNNYHGIYIANSNENSIANNTCTSNLLAAIFILSSANNKLSGNAMRESGIGFDSDSIANYTHEIDESNTVNGKPVYYWQNVDGGRVPDDGGQVIVVNCTNVAVEDQNVNNASGISETIYRYGSKEQVLSRDIPKLMLEEYVCADLEYTGECRICSV